ncbi:DUF6311 domain-containing protein [uncultured Sphingomonas sp.]|uniref:DUF6311 domain-containing protein n=1 Tax=uncultured Sphingomonas sp. TaxID=158754 RepID=UPI0035CB0A95
MHRPPAILRTHPGPRLAAVLSVLLVAGVFFTGWLHPRVVDPTSIGWLLDGEDRGQNAAGLTAYLRAPPVWPSTRQTLLSAPEGASLLLTDSNPLVGLLLRPVAGFLPAGLQFTGLWLLACVVLQAFFAWKLLRPHASDDVAAALATLLLAAAPVLINRAGHPNLCAHWLILWALWIYLDPVRARRPAHWAAVLGLAALVHSYLLLMVAAVWATAMLRAAVREPDRLRLLGSAVLVVAVVAVLLSLHGLSGERFESTGSFGRFAMTLDAWWSPSSGNFEGLQYLGAGLLMLCAVAAWATWRGLIGADARAMLRHLAWLLPAFAVLGLLALGNEWMWRGRVVASVTLPRGATDLLDPIRAAGRLFWPATYTLSFVATALTLRLPRARFLLAGACAIQLANLLPFIASVRAGSAAAADTTSFRRTADPRWASMIAHAGSVAFHPADPSLDLALVEEVQWRAIIACRPTAMTYTARRAKATRDRLAQEERAFQAGRVDPTRLYILLDQGPAWARARIRTIDGVRFIPPIRAAPPPGCG